jgi:hypothetical protein
VRTGGGALCPQDDAAELEPAGERVGAALGSPALVAPMIDRLMERAHVLNIKQGRSWRVEGPEAAPEHERPADWTPGAEGE